MANTAQNNTLGGVLLGDAEAQSTEPMSDTEQLQGVASSSLGTGQESSEADPAIEEFVEYVEGQKASKELGREATVADFHAETAGKGVELQSVQKEAEKKKELARGTSAKKTKITLAELARVKKAKEDFAEAKQSLESQKSAAVRDFADKNQKYKAAKAAAEKKYNEKMTTITNEANRLRAQDPSVPIFKSSWGIAAMLIGSLRQGLFGGQNTVQSLLNKKVEMAAKQQMRSLKSLEQSGAREAAILQAIRDSSDSELEYYEGVKAALLQDIEKNLTAITKQYNIDIKPSSEFQLRNGLLDAEEEMKTKVIESNAEVGKAQAALVAAAKRGDAAEMKAQSEAGLPSSEEKKQALGEAEDLSEKTKDIMRLASSYSELMDLVSKHFGEGGKRGQEKRLANMVLGIAPSALWPKKFSDQQAVGARAALLLLEKIKKAQGGRVSDADYKIAANYFGGKQFSQANLTTAFEGVLGDARKLMKELGGLIDQSIDPNKSADPKITYKSVLKHLPSKEELKANPTFLKFLVNSGVFKKTKQINDALQSRQ